ncbi:aldo/keto reductase family protein [Spirochaeta africana]|uniref:Putative oxidoreductase, aryl-alcohol dehydrogenase like protein n=1 Tax=Spirochaeta africana (strain ATCC 700263 / DSM 8902 / Z-7692) TaxID=889378 RepID=H9UHM8_SPIAZ|nr:aldo/keto reductase family protein [Spirochaeta africana]AFG37021.1 putative oxidoreductase, aryl-alcohol dehydrogenase like protein [Spirochaeta africana DSM 8902]
MHYRNLGTTGLKVSEIAYGSWLTFGNQVELDNAKAIIRRAVELGINYIDTADVYERGQAEQLLGEILPEYNRRQLVIATKAFWPMSDHPSDRGLSRKHIIDSINGSLQRLKLDYVDLFYCHRFDPEVPLEETLEAVQDIIRQGKALYWGTSEWTAAQIAEAWGICKARGWQTPVVNQPLYNLTNRYIESDVLPVTRNLGMGTANFSPLAQGLLTGKYSKGKIPAGSRAADERLNMFMKDQVADMDLLDRVDKLGEIAKDYNISSAQLALAWVLQQDGISSVIIGASSVKQLEDNAAASGITLKEADLRTINQLFPA